MKKVVVTVLIIIAFLILGLARIWGHSNLFGGAKINTYEKIFNCWAGDVKVCDYDPFD